MADDDIETEDMVILTVCTQYFGESSSDESDESSEDSDDEALFLKTAVAMIKRRQYLKLVNLLTLFWVTTTMNSEEISGYQGVSIQFL